MGVELQSRAEVEEVGEVPGEESSSFLGMGSADGGPRTEDGGRIGDDG